MTPFPEPEEYPCLYLQSGYYDRQKKIEIVYLYQVESILRKIMQGKPYKKTHYWTHRNDYLYTYKGQALSACEICKWRIRGLNKKCKPCNFSCIPVDSMVKYIESL